MDGTDEFTDEYWPEIGLTGSSDENAAFVVTWTSACAERPFDGHDGQHANFAITASIQCVNGQSSQSYEGARYEAN